MILVKILRIANSSASAAWPGPYKSVNRPWTRVRLERAAWEERAIVGLCLRWVSFKSALACQCLAGLYDELRHWDQLVLTTARELKALAKI